jgi:hypothetical protein
MHNTIISLNGLPPAIAWFDKETGRGFANDAASRQLQQRSATFSVDGNGISGVPVQGLVSVVEQDPYYPSSSEDAARGDNLAYLDEDGSIQLVGVKDIPADKMPPWKKQSRSSGKAPSPLPRTPSWQIVVGVMMGLAGSAMAIAGFVYLRRWREKRHGERMAALARQLECTGFNDDTDDVPELRAYKVKGAALAEMGLVAKERLDPPAPPTNLLGTRFGGAALARAGSATVAPLTSPTTQGDAKSQAPTSASEKQAEGDEADPGEADSGGVDEALGTATEPTSHTAAEIILEEAWSSALGADGTQVPAPKAANHAKFKQRQQQTYNAWFTAPSGTPKTPPTSSVGDGSSDATAAEESGAQQKSSSTTSSSGNNKRFVRRRASVAAEAATAAGTAEDSMIVPAAGGRLAAVTFGATSPAADGSSRPGSSSSIREDPLATMDSGGPTGASSGVQGLGYFAATSKPGRMGPSRWQVTSPKGSLLQQQQQGAVARGSLGSNSPSAAAEQRLRMSPAVLQVDMPGSNGQMAAELPGYTPTPTGDAQPHQQPW